MEELDDCGYQTCYIFKPNHHEQDEIDSRPIKKRKVVDDRQHQKWPKLCGGAELDTSADTRSRLFERTWAQQEERLQTATNQVDEQLLESLAQFVQKDNKSGKLKIGLLVSPVSTIAKSLVQNLQPRTADSKRKSEDVLFELNAIQCSNLQITLKNVIRYAIESHSSPESYFSFLSQHKRLIPMNFDLELLQRYVKKQSISKIIISILDIEAFDTGILSELLSTLASWTDRIPFVLLVGVVTTVELFESRLPKSIIRLLDPQIFELGSDGDHLYKILHAMQIHPKLFLGPVTLSALYEVSQDQSATSDELIRSFKYIYMSHFFANPLSLLLDDNRISIDPVICEAIRNTESFREHCEKLIQKKSEHDTLRKLLNNDQFLFETARQAVESGMEQMQNTQTMLNTFSVLYTSLGLPLQSFELEVQLHQSLSSLNSTEIYDKVFSTIEQLPSDSLADLLFQDFCEAFDFETIANLKRSLQILHQDTRSVRPNHTTSTTKPGPKSNPKPTTEQAYAAILRTFTSYLETYFSNLTSPTDLLLHEAFIYDLKFPLSFTINPRPRYALERALSSPADYLACDCCTSSTSDHTTLSSLPPTSVLHTLLSEAGAIINVRDLWDAFRNIVSPDQSTQRSASATASDKDNENDDEEAEDESNSTAIAAEEIDGKITEPQAMALFYRSLAELKMFGLIKQSKKKPGVECLAKTNWRGM